MQKIKLLKSLIIPTLGISAIGTIAITSTSCESRKKNVKITAHEDSTLELINHGGNTPILQYSTDEKKWQNYENEEEIKIPKGTSYYFKGWNIYTGWSIYMTTYSTFLIQGNVSISGNIIGLLDNGKGTLSQIPNSSCFYHLFENSTGITSVSEDFLSVKNLSIACYDGMFMNCTKLEKAPDLPATSLPQICYQRMFKGCTALTAAPALPATYLTMSCYYGMFVGCTTLTTAPDLPAQSLANYCYWSMFYGCTSLTSIQLGYTGNYNYDYFNNWVIGVAPTGIFHYNGRQTAQDFGFPDGWTKQPL